MITTPEHLNTTEAAERHFASLASRIGNGADSLDREAADAEADGNQARAIAKREGAQAARAYARHVSTEWTRTSWLNLSEEAQAFAHACECSGILMDPIGQIEREEAQAAKGYSALSGPQIDVPAAKAKRAVYLRLVSAGRFVHIDETINGVKQLPFFAITGYYPAVPTQLTA